MQIIAHRGCWELDIEKNSAISFQRAFSLGFGVETDVRDYHHQLVISHDMPDQTAMSVEEFLIIYKAFDKSLPLALNIKADGLQHLLKEVLKKFGIENYFVFDMAVPDTVYYLKTGLKIFSRQSEYEKDVIFYDQAEGVWLDEFNSHWITSEIIQNHLKNEKDVCIVSPELHKRSYSTEWNDYKKIETNLNIKNLFLCTDFPKEADQFFNG